MAPTPASAQNAPVIEYDELMRKRNEFITSMAMLRNAADDASRTALAYFDVVTADAVVRAGGSLLTNGANGAAVNNLINDFARAASLAPGARGYTEEDDGTHHEDGKKIRKKRNVKPKDPNAPKKPATPFLLFCQTGRETVKGDLGPEASYHDVQEELKRRWNTEANKEEWSNLYQKRLTDWKAEKKEYDTQKAATEGGEIPSTTTTPAAPTSAPAPGSTARVVASPAAPRASLGFTAVNHNAKPSNAQASGEEPEAEQEDDEDEEEEEEEATATAPEEPAEDANSDSDSSLSEPPPKPKAGSTKKKTAKSTPIKPPAAVSSPVVAEKEKEKETPVAPTEPPKKKRGRPPKRAAETEAAEDTIAVAAAVAEETPKRKRNKRRKSGAE